MVNCTSSSKPSEGAADPRPGAPEVQREGSGLDQVGWMFTLGAIFYLRPHEIRGPPPLLENVQNILKGGPFLTILCTYLRRGGAPPPREYAKLACLMKPYTTPPSILTLVTWVP